MLEAVISTPNMSLVAFWKPGTVDSINMKTEVSRNRELRLIKIFNIILFKTFPFSPQFYHGRFRRVGIFKKKPDCTSHIWTTNSFERIRLEIQKGCHGNDGQSRTVPESPDQTCPPREVPRLLFVDKIQTILINAKSPTKNVLEIMV